MRLDDAQRRAVEHAGGPMLVLAGPGTGKTRVITHRIAHLIRERGVEPRSIVAVTFTVRAAASLRSRLAELVSPAAAEGIFAGTFHSFARTIIDRFPDRLGFARAPIIMDSAMHKRLLREVIASRAQADPRGAAAGEEWLSRARRAIAEFHQHALSPEDVRARIASREAEIEQGRWSAANGDVIELDDVAQLARREDLGVLGRLHGVFERAEALRRERGWVGFDELLTEPIRLLRDDERAAAVCLDEHRHIVVDEYQDTNHAQAELLSLLSPPGSGRDLMVVGDDDQAIYDFRGADDLAFDRFERRWTGCEQVRLSRNYRSSPAVIEAANATIERAAHRFAPDKTIEPGTHSSDDQFEGARVELVELSDHRLDGDAIARLILAERAEGGGDARPWGSYAVIVRTHGDAARVESALELAGIPHRGQRAGDITDEPGVRRLLAWIELLSDPSASWLARGLLSAPPISAPPEAALRWEKAYAAARSRAEHPSRLPGFAAWLASQEDDPDADAIERFTRLFGELQAIAHGEPAERAVLEIIRRAQLAEGELPGTRDRARRVRSLVEAIGFARSLQRRLPMPGDVASLWAYYQDLDDAERSMGRAIGERALEQDAPDEQPQSDQDGEGHDVDAVQVITAHASKGLEFDTVFIPRVSPGHGYPMSRRRDRAVPADLVDDRAGDARSEQERRFDEERRLFYVALTRAERRVVMLTKRTKSKSKSQHFAQQLTADLGDQLTVIDGAAVLAPEAQTPEAALGGGRARDGLELELGYGAVGGEASDAERAARRAAADALSRVRSAADEAAFEQAVEQLRGAAARIAARGFAGRGERAPAWLGVAPPEPESPGSFIEYRPVRGPLKLSYTSVHDYTRCPRCWYLARVLRLPSETSEALVVGHAVHEALHRFYDRLRQAEASGETPPGIGALRSMARRAYEAAVPADEQLRPEVAASVEAMAVSAHEHLHEPECEILELERRLVADWPEAGEGWTMEAKLDRVDRLGADHRIVDYKTGTPRGALLEPEADDLQLAIYAAVAQRAGLDLGEGWAEYWLLRTGQRGRIRLSDLDLESAIQAVAEAAAGMREGRFESGRNCDRCAWIEDQGR